MFSSILLCQIILTVVCRTLCYEPTEKDLICFNNYEKEMKCSLPSESLRSCSGYKLDVTHIKHSNETYTCIFERSHDGSCECKIEVNRFVIGEKFIIALLEETKVLLKKQLSTHNFIKPKTPVLKVHKTENGNLNVTWDSRYNNEEIFAQKLKINLTYGIKGGDETISEMKLNTVGFHEIVSSYLQPSTEYVLTAKMGTDYNDYTIFSDPSEPVHFNTPSSPNQIVKMVVPLLCVALFIIICTVFICVLRIKKNWWDKIAKPKIDARLEENVVNHGHILPTPSMMFSTIHVEIPKLDLEDKKELISALSVDTNNERSSPSLESASAVYGQAGAFSGSKKEISSPVNFQSRVQQALDEDLKFLLVTNNTPISPNMPNIGIDDAYSREHSRANRDSGNCSGSSVFSNMSYLESATDDSSFLEQLNCDHSYQSDKRNVSGFPTNDALEDGYKSFNAVLDKGNDMNVGGNLSTDVDADDKIIMKNLLTSSNPLYPHTFHHDGSITSDDEYRDFQDLTKSTEGQWSTSVTTEQALTECGALKHPHSAGQDPTPLPSSWASFLHFSPIIQIDNSYQAV